jgi:hypothetical protein
MDTIAGAAHTPDVLIEEAATYWSSPAARSFINDTNLTASGGYGRLFEDWQPAPIRAATLWTGPPSAPEVVEFLNNSIGLRMAAAHNDVVMIGSLQPDPADPTNP